MLLNVLVAILTVIVETRYYYMSLISEYKRITACLVNTSYVWHTYEREIFSEPLK